MNNNEYRINALPAKTWYQLNMNDTRLLWDDNLVPCDMDTKGCDNVCSDVNAKDYSDIENAVLTGAGKEADVLFEAGVTNTLLVKKLTARHYILMSMAMIRASQERL